MIAEWKHLLIAKRTETFMGNYCGCSDIATEGMEITWKGSDEQ